MLTSEDLITGLNDQSVSLVVEPPAVWFALQLLSSVAYAADHLARD